MSENRKRSIRLTLRLDENEDEILTKKTTEFCKTKNEFIRQLILKSDPAEIKENNLLLLQILKQKRGIGSNLNQLAKKINSTEKYDPDLLLEEIRELKKEVESIWQFLKQ